MMLSIRNKKLRRVINNSGMATADGMSSVWSLKLFGFKEAERVYGPDLILAFSKIASKKGYGNYYLGGKPGVPELLAKKMKERFPGLRVVGTYSPPYRPMTPDENKAMVEIINRTEPDVVWVGMSTPKQDFWMAEHVGKINAQVMVGVGAAFDFLSGVKPQAPLWMQRNGLEWLFRLFHEPGRLWKRNVLHIPCIMLVFMQKIGVLRFNS
jgi:N-acetylglucosaminyldiphosphoundecaprenol N-acetyl-beta-D-mannosaminyltransferase